MSRDYSLAQKGKFLGGVEGDTYIGSGGGGEVRNHESRDSSYYIHIDTKSQEWEILCKHTTSTMYVCMYREWVPEQAVLYWESVRVPREDEADEEEAEGNLIQLQAPDLDLEHLVAGLGARGEFGRRGGRDRGGLVHVVDATDFQVSNDQFFTKKGQREEKVRSQA